MMSFTLKLRRRKPSFDGHPQVKSVNTGKVLSAAFVQVGEQFEHSGKKALNRQQQPATTLKLQECKHLKVDLLGFSA